MAAGGVHGVEGAELHEVDVVSVGEPALSDSSEISLDWDSGAEDSQEDGHTVASMIKAWANKLLHKISRK